MSYTFLHFSHFFKILKCCIKLRKRNFWGGSNWIVVALGVLVICPIDKNGVPKPKIGFFWLQISKFGGKNCTFSSLAAHCNAFRPCWSMFLREATKSFPKTKRCLIGSPIFWYQNFCSLPKILGFMSKKKDQIWPKICIFGHLGQILAFLAHLVPCPTKKTMQMSCLSGFLICGYQNFAPFKKLGYLAKNGQFCSQKMLSQHI